MKWDYLLEVARKIVEDAQNELPDGIREKAQSVPVAYEGAPSETLVADGLEPDILGLFVGNDYASEDINPQALPTQILLFLENIRDLAEGDDEAYREEVRLTYLHELGHYLGWDEVDLEARGLL